MFLKCNTDLLWPWTAIEDRLNGSMYMLLQFKCSTGLGEGKVGKVALEAPSARALQKMADICSTYGNGYELNYN